MEYVLKEVELSKKKLMLLGDEAIAQGAIDAGMSGIYAYPGTPSTEITEYVQSSKEAEEKGIHRQWSANEKTAVESALGMSYAGKRAMACMKHVGLNVAADAFINAAVTGVNGGLIVVAADDPSMHSSQNEQDSRYYGKFALIPCLEPTTVQEAYDMTFYGYELSERFKIPVLMRITTRLAHSRGGVERRQRLPENELKLPVNMHQFVLLPALARKSYDKLIELQELFKADAEVSPYNQYFSGENKKMGIIACGLGYNYLMENFMDEACPYPVIKIGQYPVPRKMIARLVDECDEILVIEDGMPVIEEILRGLLNRGIKVKGRMSGQLPRSGELDPNSVRLALGLPDLTGAPVPDVLVGRPPSFCKGCAHADSYDGINESIKDVFGPGHIFSDIGCYTLGALPPYESISSCVDMGASITMAKGAADAGLFPSCAVIGDSTFCHSGMTALLDVIVEQTNMIVFIADNSTTGMTGGQASHAFGRIESICLGLGIDKEHFHIVKMVPNMREEFVKIIKKELEYNGPSVIVPTRECVQTLRKRVKK